MSTETVTPLDRDVLREWAARRQKARPPRPRFDITPYPWSLGEYVGQPRAKRQLGVAVRAARMRAEPLRHVLVTSGTAGVGKTALAVALACELNRNIEVLSGRLTADDAMEALAMLADGDVLFLDEGHRLVEGGKRNAEWLLHLLADGAIIDGKGVHPQPKVTVILATTDVGRLPETITSRFPIVCQLEDYSLEDALAILASTCERVLPDSALRPDEATSVALVEAANRNPRTIANLLHSWSDAQLVETEDDPIPFEEILSWAGLTADGLDRVCQRLLVVLASEFGGTAGERTLVSRLREPGGIRYAERTLQAKGLLNVGPDGRSLTKDGFTRAAQLAKEGVIP